MKQKPYRVIIELIIKVVGFLWDYLCIYKGKGVSCNVSTGGNMWGKASLCINPCKVPKT